MDKQGRLTAFVELVAELPLFAETDAGRDENPQKDLDWLIERDAELERMIHAARVLKGRILIDWS